MELSFTPWMRAYNLLSSMKSTKVDFAQQIDNREGTFPELDGGDDLLMAKFICILEFSYSNVNKVFISRMNYTNKYAGRPLVSGGIFYVL